MFKKRESIDILDIPELHRKKLIKLPPSPKYQETKVTNDGYFVFSPEAPKQEIVNQQPEAKPEAQTQFLSNFASIGLTNPQITPEVRKEDNAEVKDLKWRLENLEFKLEQLIERVNSINR
mgnify:CR=1 FL=1